MKLAPSTVKPSNAITTPVHHTEDLGSERRLKNQEHEEDLERDAPDHDAPGDVLAVDAHEPSHQRQQEEAENRTQPVE